jgi:hypothetical protein
VCPASSVVLLLSMLNKILRYFGYQMVECWVICDDGRCMPKSKADGKGQPVDIEWVEESRRGWSKKDKIISA